MTPIGSIDSLLAQVQRTTSPSSKTAGADFGSAISQALGKVSDMQNNATALQRRFELEDSSVGLEQAVVSMQKSQIGFQATLQVRNKLVQAYTDIMNMQV